MKIDYDTTRPDRDGFTVDLVINSVGEPFPQGTLVHHLLLRRGGAVVDLPLEEAREVVGLLVERINEIDSGAWLEKICKQNPKWPYEIRG